VGGQVPVLYPLGRRGRVTPRDQAKPMTAPFTKGSKASVANIKRGRANAISQKTEIFQVLSIAIRTGTNKCRTKNIVTYGAKSSEGYCSLSLPQTGQMGRTERYPTINWPLPQFGHLREMPRRIPVRKLGDGRCSMGASALFGGSSICLIVGIVS